MDTWFSPTVGHLFLVVISLLLFVHAYVLMRIRNILQAISMNFDTITYFCRKIAPNASKSLEQPEVKKTCQFCRHRLAYINTSKTEGDEDDFYHVCGLKNVQIKLADSCDKFELEPQNNL